MVSNYGIDLTRWVANAEIWVVPMLKLNLEGNSKIWTSSIMKSMNTRGGYGIDIDGNYSAFSRYTTSPFTHTANS